MLSDNSIVGTFLNLFKAPNINVIVACLKIGLLQFLRLDLPNIKVWL